MINAIWNRLPRSVIDSSATRRCERRLLLSFRNALSHPYVLGLTALLMVCKVLYRLGDQNRSLQSQNQITNENQDIHSTCPQESFCHPMASISMILKMVRNALSTAQPTQYTTLSIKSALRENPNANLLYKIQAQQNQPLWNPAQWHCHSFQPARNWMSTCSETFLALLKRLLFFP